MTKLGARGKRRGEERCDKPTKQKKCVYCNKIFIGSSEINWHFKKMNIEECFEKNNKQIDDYFKELCWIII